MTKEEALENLKGDPAEVTNEALTTVVRACDRDERLREEVKSLHPRVQDGIRHVRNSVVHGQK